MKKLKLFFALFAMLALGVTNAWGAEEVTYVFTSKDWAAKIGSTAANWTSNKPGAGFSNNGIQVTTAASGANGTSPISYDNISQIVVTYNTNTSKGQGTLSVKIGDNAVTTNNWKYSGSANGTTANFTSTFDYPSPQSGKVTLTANTTTNSIYVVSIKIVTSAGGSTPEPDPDPTPDPTPEPGGEALSYTWDLSTNSYSAASTTQVTWSATDVNMVADKGTAGTAPNNYLGGDANNRTSSRFYQNSILTITPEANVTITSVVFTATGTSYASALQGSTWTNASASVSSTTVTVTPTNGTNAISAKIAGTCGFTGVTVHYTKAASGEPENPTPSVSVEPASYNFATTNVGETATQEFTITAKNTEATLSASIDNTTDFAISAIITGDKVTVTYQPKSAGDHTATMTVKAGEEASTTVALTGKAVAALEGTWILVTDASSLKAGDEIIIASKDENYALSRAQNTNNRGQVEVTKTDNTITATTEAQVLTLQAGKTEGTLALYTGTGYLHAASSSANHLKTETELSDNSSWTIAVEADGTATLTAQGTYTRNILCYNKSNKLFACYASTNLQQPIVIYKNTNGQQLAELAYATTKYLTKLGDTFTTPTLTNPYSLTVTYSSSDNNVATVDNTGTVTIKAAGVVVITAAFAGDASYLEGSASYTIGVTEHAGTQADPYSVADARRVIDVMETAEGVYATGIVSEIETAYNATYGNITYNISIDGTTVADQLQAYRGKSYNGANFTSADDIKLGDEVVVKGNLKKHNTTYEFDTDNQLVSLNRTKQQADLAYAETELTANVGEDFAEPTLSNPYSLSITYSSSNTTLATVNATTGEVTILAAGKVTITASTAGDATYAAGSASYNITITNPGLAVATLPFYFDGKRADIEGTAGMTHEGIDSDYNAAPYLKFNTAGDWAIVQFDSEPGEFSFLLKQNGQNAGTFTVYESANGEDYTPIWSGGDLGGNGQSATIEPTLSATARYVKFEYTTKGASTNYGLGSISIQKADHRAEAGIAWNPATVSLTVGDAFTAPTFNNPNGLSGITFASSNEALATVNNAGAITLVSGKTGTATITATFADSHADYKPAEATCVITVSPKSEKVVILAQYNGQWYALKADKVDNKTVAALEVTYFEGKLYNVDDAAKALIEWDRAVVDGNATFKNGENYLSAVNSADLTLSTNACDWVYEDGIYKIESSDRTFLYRVAANGFKNYDKDNADTDDYSSLPVVTAPVYVNSANALTGKFSTGEYEYAEFAPGNLQYNVGSSTWAFAANQYDVIGEPNINVGDPTFTGTIDMFGWSTDDAGNNLGVNPSMATTFYTGNFVDWGKLFPVADNYSTLTHNQWYYLLNERANASSLKQVAYVGTFFGIMLFPDNWTYPDGCKIDPTLNHDDADGDVYDFYSYNYTLAQWTELEAAGAVFLPAAGRRFGGYGNTYNSNGDDTGSTIQDQHSTNGLACYWTSSKHTDNIRVSSLFNLLSIGGNKYKYGILNLGWYGYGNIGQSVRLAKVTSTLIEIGGGDNSQVISDNADKTVNVKLDRPFNTSGWGTLCVPFEMSASVIGEAYELGTITKHQTGEGINLNLAKVETIEAGKPYLIKANVPSLDVIKNVTIVNTTGSSYTVTGDGIMITFTGLINRDGQTNGSTEYYVGANDGYLYNATVDKLGLRALFTITDEAGNPTKVRARVVTREDAATGFENITTTDKAVKIIENGQLIIIRNGEKFNAQGVKF